MEERLARYFAQLMHQLMKEAAMERRPFSFVSNRITIE